MAAIDGFELQERLGSGDAPETHRGVGPGGVERLVRVFHRKNFSGERNLAIQSDLPWVVGLDAECFAPVEAHGTDGDLVWYRLGIGPTATLAERLEGSDGPALELSEVLGVGLRLSQALARVHQEQKVFGDLAPSKIFLGEPGRVWIDRPTPGSASGKAASDDVAGIRYASPEQVQLDTVQAPSDLYQVGLILYHALTGRLPLEDENPFQTVLRRMQEEMPPPSRFSDRVPPEVDRIVLKCLAAEPMARYADGGALLKDLETLDPGSGRRVDGLPEVEPPSSSVEGLLLPPRENRPAPKGKNEESKPIVFMAILAGAFFFASLVLLLR